MAFFNQMGMAPQIGGGGGASAFTSPGMDPMTLAALLRMQGGGMAQSGPGSAPAPQMPGMPQQMANGMAGGQQAGMANMLNGLNHGLGGANIPLGATQQPGGQNLMQILSGLGGAGSPLGGAPGVQGGGLMQLLRSLGIGGASGGIQNNVPFANMMNNAPPTP